MVRTSQVASGSTLIPEQTLDPAAAREVRAMAQSTYNTSGYCHGRPNVHNSVLELVKAISRFTVCLYVCYVTSDSCKLQRLYSSLRGPHAHTVAMTRSLHAWVGSTRFSGGPTSRSSTEGVCLGEHPSGSRLQ